MVKPCILKEKVHIVHPFLARIEFRLFRFEFPREMIDGMWHKMLTMAVLVTF